MFDGAAYGRLRSIGKEPQTLDIKDGVHLIMLKILIALVCSELICEFWIYIFCLHYWARMRTVLADRCFIEGSIHVTTNNSGLLDGINYIRIQVALINIYVYCTSFISWGPH